MACQLQQGLGRVIGFRVDGGVVQYAFTLRHPQKARALLEGLGPQLGNLFDLGAGGKDTIFLPVDYHVFGRGAVQPRHPLQKGGGCGVDIHAYGVDAVLHHTVQGVIQPLLGHIVLILPHADGLGIDLYQLRQRVL